VLLAENKISGCFEVVFRRGSGLIRKMGFSDDLIQAQISMFERGIRQPSLPILGAYAKAANVYIEALITDDVDLPRRLPADSKSEGIKRRR
jgi:transcriptional regulator with XRE-family HTH domain